MVESPIAHFSRNTYGVQKSTPTTTNFDIESTPAMPTVSPIRLTSKPRKIPACEPCRGMKVKCDHGKPSCSRCRENGKAAACAYRPRPFKRPLRRSSQEQRQVAPVFTANKHFCNQDLDPEKTVQPPVRQMHMSLEIWYRHRFNIRIRAIWAHRAIRHSSTSWHSRTTKRLALRVNKVQ